MKRSPIRPRRPSPRRRNAPRWTVPDWLDANTLLAARSGDRCECCAEPLNGRVERHHRVRRTAKSGGDRMANIIALLPACHAYAHAHPDWARDRGLIVPTWLDPSETPVLWRGTEWMQFLDDGTMRRLDLGPEYRLST